ncbi:MAG: toxin-antitoxin system HicB family antitoxin [Bryobacteraceae bacterium]
MAPRKAFPLRLDPAIYDELQRWANSELRSLNGQIEYLLRRALRDAGRLPAREQEKHAEDPDAIHKRKQK